MERVFLGEKLKELREKFNYTQADIASMLDVDQGTVSQYESGERQASTDMLEKLGDLYCCDLVHTIPVDSPALQVSFYASSINRENMKAIQTVNRAFLNSVFMAGALKAEIKGTDQAD